MWCENVDWSEIEAYWKHSNLGFNDCLKIAVDSLLDPLVEQAARELAFTTGQKISELASSNG